MVYSRSLEERVSDLEKGYSNLEVRVKDIEQSSKRVFLENNWFDIVGNILKLFSSVDSLMQVYCKKREEGCEYHFRSQFQ